MRGGLRTTKRWSLREGVGDTGRSAPMSERNYWQRLRRNRMSRRSLLRSSARAGIGATGLALVGCGCGCGGGGGDDDDAQPAAAQAQQQPQQEQAMQQEQAEQQAEQQAMQQEQQEEAAVAQVQQQKDQQQVGPAAGEIGTEATLRIAQAKITAAWTRSTQAARRTIGTPTASSSGVSATTRTRRRSSGTWSAGKTRTT